MKTCNKCRETKPLSEFHKRGTGYKSQCKCCRSTAESARYEENKDHIKSRIAVYYSNNKEEANARSANWYLQNKDRHSCLHEKWVAQNKENLKRYYSQYSANNRGKRNAANAKRRAAKKRATPEWSEKELIDIVYQRANELGFEVDHVVPLQSDIVCGLHCWYNLQLLDQPLNAGKHNKHWPDMP